MAGEFGVLMAIIGFTTTMVVGSIFLVPSVSVIVVALLASIVAIISQFSVYFVSELVYSIF